MGTSYSRAERMVINMATARAIGVSPRFRILLDAELLNQEVNLGVRTLSLPAVVRESSLVNLDLAAADRDRGGREADRPGSQIGPASAF